MKLYEFGPARSVRCRWTLSELGLVCEGVPTNLRAGEHRTPEFLALNPGGKIPVLQDGDFTLTESAAICLYLAEQNPDKHLLPPAGTRERARVYEWMFFCVTELEPPLWRMAKHQNLLPEDQRIPAAVELAKAEFLAAAHVMDKKLGDQPYAVGGSFTVADILLAYTLDWATMHGFLNELPRLTAYVERMFARPGAPQRMAQVFAAMRR